MASSTGDDVISFARWPTERASSGVLVGLLVDGIEGIEAGNSGVWCTNLLLLLPSICGCPGRFAGCC